MFDLGVRLVAYVDLGSGFVFFFLCCDARFCVFWVLVLLCYDIGHSGGTMVVTGQWKHGARG